jgi:hypothetical protein
MFGTRAGSAHVRRGARPSVPADLKVAPRSRDGVAPSLHDELAPPPGSVVRILQRAAESSGRRASRTAVRQESCAFAGGVAPTLRRARRKALGNAKANTIRITNPKTGSTNPTLKAL